MSHFNIERFDKWAATYDTSVLRRWYFGPIQSRMLELLGRHKLIESPSTILDVGCGTGRLLKAASIRWPKAKIFGVDPAGQMISHARQLNPNATFEVSTAESLPFADRTMDLVFSSLSFHHWMDQEKGMKEIARVLRPKGVFCLADHTMHITKCLNENVKSGKQIRTLAGNAGLSIIAQKRLWLRYVLITLAQKRS